MPRHPVHGRARPPLGHELGCRECDVQISVSTGYDRPNEGIDVLAARLPGMYGALLTAKAAGHDYVDIDGTLIETGRCATAGPTTSADPRGRATRAAWRQRPSRHRPRRLADPTFRMRPVSGDPRSEWWMSADRRPSALDEPAEFLRVQDEVLVLDIEHQAVDGVNTLIVELAEL